MFVFTLPNFCIVSTFVLLFFWSLICVLLPMDMDFTFLHKLFFAKYDHPNRMTNDHTKVSVFKNARLLKTCRPEKDSRSCNELKSVTFPYILLLSARIHCTSSKVQFFRTFCHSLQENIALYMRKCTWLGQGGRQISDPCKKLKTVDGLLQKFSASEIWQIFTL